jgi:alkanesulfonate monooxygenase SsuD/methylene tetrahydromethanopterin reductase-like flavin-dependent oxidoreductase (luciferase family)
MHLMPYADLDLEYADEDTPAAWIVLSNSHYDPVKGHALYKRYLDECAYAEELGFEGVVMNEHHQTAYGTMPQPSVTAGALAHRLRTAKIAIVGRALPFVGNPMCVAEEYAMLDVITGGRFIAGFVRGIGCEYHSLGGNPTESHERFYEAHDLILRAWTEPGPFRFEGKYHDLSYVNLWPRPYQKPHPPIWIPSLGSRETIVWASAKERRYTYIQTFSPAAAMVRFMGMYREEARRSGYEASPDQLGWASLIYVAETDEQAIAEARPHIEAFVNKFLRLPMEMLLPPGYLSTASYKAVMQAKQSISRTRTIADLLAADQFLCGSPATVRAKLEEYQDRGQFNLTLALLQFGTLPADLTRKNMTLFATEVMPHLADRQPSPS